MLNLGRAAAFYVTLVCSLIYNSIRSYRTPDCRDTRFRNTIGNSIHYRCTNAPDNRHCMVVEEGGRCS